MFDYFGDECRGDVPDAQRLAAADAFVAQLSAARPRGAAEARDVSRPEVAAPAEVDAALSRPVQQLVEAVQAVAAQTPSDLPGPQALADTAALLAVIEQLHVTALGRVADVDTRQLHTLVGAPSTSTWVAQQQTSMDRGQVALARRLAALPRVDAAVRAGELSVTAAERIGRALVKLRRHVDRPDGLIDGQDAEQALVGVIGHGVRGLICQGVGGFEQDDPRLAGLIADLAQIVETPTGQLARLEAAFVLLARHLEPAQLPGALGTLVDALLPNELERRAQDGHTNRGFGVQLKPDGSGYWITEGDLDLECGELLLTFLTAEEAVDPDKPRDTQGYEQLRADGWQPGDGVPEEMSGCGGPRSKRQRRHDALKNGLRRCLDAGIAGMRDKVAPHLDVIVGLDALHEAPGALPAVSAHGARLPGSLVRRWLCDSALTRFVLGLGGKVIETSHTQRTLKPHERRAKRIETGGQCQAAGCHPPPGTPLVPHHGDPWAKTGTTRLDDTVLFCDSTHHDLHSGGKTIRLKDGRWLNADGWTDGPGR